MDAKLKEALIRFSDIESLETSIDEDLLERQRRIDFNNSPNPLSVKGVKDLTDLGNAERMYEKFGDQLRYSNISKRWYVWNGQFWQVDNKRRVDSMAAEVVKSMYYEAIDLKDRDDIRKVASHAIKSQSNPRLEAIVKLLRSTGDIPIAESEFDINPELLNCLNGTIDLDTGELREHRKEDLITKICPVEFDPEARSVEFEKFLHESTNGDKELQQFIQRAVGYSTSGYCSEEVFFFLYGPSATGKSTFIESIKACLGEYAITSDISAFLKHKNNSIRPRNDIARLVGARMILSSEADESSNLDTNLVKLFTGGDTITVRFLNKEFFEYKPTGKLWIAANYPPKVSSDDGAIWRRIIRIPFEHEIPKEQRDPKVKAQLCDPRISGPAILSWAIEGYLLWQMHGLSPPESVLESTESYRIEMNPIHEFIDECCDINLNNNQYQETVKDLWSAYTRHADENNIRFPIKGKNQFGKHLRSYGLQPGQRSGDRARMYQGIQLRTNENS